MIQIDTKRFLEGLELLQAGIVQAAQRSMREAVRAAEASARGTSRFQDRTGETRGSIRGETAGFEGFVSAGGAAGFLENGTRPHVIMGNPILRFTVNGQVLFRRWVRHPGTNARPFMAEARQVGEQALAYGTEFFINEAIARVH